MLVLAGNVVSDSYATEGDIPINEQNFLSWKHFKRALYFDRDHRVSEMPNNPNIMCVATFHTQDYVPLSFQLKIKNYDTAQALNV